MNKSDLVRHVAEEVGMTGSAAEAEYGPVIRDCLSILRDRFAGDDEVEGYRRDGPVAVALFEMGEGEEADQREGRLLRRREINSVMERHFSRIAQEAA